MCSNLEQAPLFCLWKECIARVKLKYRCDYKTCCEGLFNPIPLCGNSPVFY